MNPERLVAESRALYVEAPEDGPPLILACRTRLTEAARANLRRSWEEAWRRDYRGPGPRVMILDAGLELFQLVDGQWREVAGAECNPLPPPGLGRPDDPPPAV